MKRKALSSLLFLILIALHFSITGNVAAFDLITAQEACDMVANNQAKLIDVRTLEEYVFVGSPALESGGDPIAYLIPWEHLKGIDEYGNNEYRINPDFDELIEQTFGDDKNQALIIICRSGNRSTYAADRMEELGFSNVYEVDNKLREMTSYPGGRGGFQGSSYNSSYSGYRGYPGRLPNGLGSSIVKVQTVTDNIDSEDDSVSWMDTGLPMTQKADPDKIPKIKREASANVVRDSKTVLQTTNAIMNYQGFNFQGISNYVQQPTYSLSFYQSPLSQSLFSYGQQQLLYQQPYSWYQPNQSLYQSFNIFYGVQAPSAKTSNQSSSEKEEKCSSG
ncbi:MAG: rhodanese-like domain-containing protein [bacterium]